MGLDIYFFQQAKDKPDAGEYDEVGYFRKVNPLLNWIDNHVGKVRNQVLIEVTKAQLAALLNDLQRLTPDNCGEVYPTLDGFFYGNTGYDETYWQDARAVTDWVKATLETFDSANNRLLFYAWW
ncbi:hypothetical protein EHN07_03790 [Buttiauxella warmboldiae]|uniref:Uncharacterized protein n=1 Tax=Buttiauxella warmboldiae TaxID=82993 RepID=A0A3N5DNF4_9ENTR|nr:hypothetical protein [Buttiauxella warmboldiae]RPH30234.1 hypothetical protein EHN07_03790 [Buttiauxella warmboldiae]